MIVPRMAMAGYKLADETPPRRLMFELGDGSHVGVVVHPALDGGTILAAFGQAPRAVRKAFASLRD